MTLSDRFAPYDGVDKGICIIAYERRSTIVYCNRIFASYLSTHPKNIEGRSLDEITAATELHFKQLSPFVTRNTGAVQFMGGFCIKVIDQIDRHEPLTRTLKISRVETELFDDQLYFIGYVRLATKLELWLNRLKLDTNIDPYIRPVATFFLSGHWRPYATLTSPLWMPYVVTQAPEVQAFLKMLIQS
ncbi:MAG: PAS fold [Phormidesmis priestleyi Ana]|uniref:PAS fold n=1 Tax=Phormidesmis priestleyi Ana TaxID=1666911 RepID=A0A0P8DEF2_9CYAN|nr:MAG: PAS fold [Phormidesmis priestleyi Ana]